MDGKIPIHKTEGMHFEYNGELVTLVKRSIVNTGHSVTCSVANDDVIFENVDATILVDAKPGTLYG